MRTGGMKDEETKEGLLGNINFSEIEEKDPSLAEGHHLLYDREIPFELRLEDSNGPQEVASFEAIRAKILMGGNDAGPNQIRIELSCENDLFFYFTSDVDQETFKVMQDNQKLCVEFKDYPNLTKKLMNNCINEPQSYIAVFIMQKEGTARLDFIQNIEYKFIELLSIDFVNSPDDTVRKQIAYRYNALRTKLELMQDRINTISNIVKTKNPSLLLTIQKTSANKLNTTMTNKNTSYYNKMTTRSKKVDTSMNDSEGDQYPDLDNKGDEGEEEEQQQSNTEKPKRKIGIGSGIMHLLPIHLNTNDNASTRANVDAYFESFIKENEFKVKDSNYCQYTSCLRGHPVNGKKNTNVQGVAYYQLLSSDNDSVYEVNQVKPINEYFLWQYDDPYTGSNPLNNIRDTMTKLDILK